MLKFIKILPDFDFFFNKLSFNLLNIILNYKN